MTESGRGRASRDSESRGPASREGRENLDPVDEKPGGSPEPETTDVERQKGDDRPSEQSEEASGGVRAAFRKHPVAILVCGGLIVLGAIGGIAWYLHARHYESTDDAFIDARPVLVSPQVTGNIISVNVTDDQVVKTGDLLAKIDPRDYEAAFNQADAQIRQAEATITNLKAQISTQEAQIVQASQQVTEAQAALTFAEQENAHFQDLAQKGSGTIERAQQAASDLKGRRAALDASVAAKAAAERQIPVLQAQMEVTAAQRDQYVAQKGSRRGRSRPYRTACDRRRPHRETHRGRRQWRPRRRRSWLLFRWTCG